MAFNPNSEFESSIDKLLKNGTATKIVMTPEEIEREGMEALVGGESCPDRDFSFTHIMKRKIPPTIRLVGCPDDLKSRPDEAGRYVDHFNDIPEVTPDQVKCGRTEPQEVEDWLDTYYKDGQSVSSVMAPQIMPTFDTFMRTDPAWVERNVIGPDPNEQFDPNRTFTPCTVRDKPTQPVDNPFYNSRQLVNPAKRTQKTVVKQKQPSVRTKRLIEMLKPLQDTSYYTKRAKLQETKDELKNRKQISGEVIALQVEKDRATAEINTLDPLEDAEQICSLRQHVEVIDQRIDGYNYSYGVEPQALREPSGFEKFVRKLRGGIAYVGGKIASGIVRLFGGGNPAFQAVPVLCGIGAFVFGMFRFMRR